MGTKPEHDSADPAGKRSGEPTFSEAISPEISIRSADLFKGRREVLIQHEGLTYRLRVTKNGKLILHK